MILVALGACPITRKARSMNKLELAGNTYTAPHSFFICFPNSAIISMF